MEKKSLGKFIAELRKEKNLTQRELGDILSVSDKTVSHWEREESSPDISLLPFLAETLGITVDELLKGEKKSAAPPKFYYELPEKTPDTLTERFHKFKIATVIATAIAVFSLALSVISLIISLSGSEYFFITFIPAFPNIFLPLVITLIARIYLSRSIYPEKDKKNKILLFKANKLSFINLCLSVLSLAACLIPFTQMMSYVIGSALLSISGILLISLFATALFLRYKRILPKRGDIPSSHSELFYLRRNTAILMALLLMISGTNTFLMIKNPPLSYKTETITFYDPIEFKAYMEEEKEPLHYIEATVIYENNIIQENDAVYYTADDKTEWVRFKWKNKQVSRTDINYNENGTPYVDVLVYVDNGKEKAAFELLEKLSLLTYVISIGLPLGLYFYKKRKLQK